MKCVACKGRGHHDSGLFMEPCVICGGTGEVDSDTPTYEPIKARTNFKKITESPEALAEFVHEAESMYERCCKGDLRCDYCGCKWCGLAGRKHLIDWLNEECKE